VTPTVGGRKEELHRSMSATSTTIVGTEVSPRDSHAAALAAAPGRIDVMWRWDTDRHGEVAIAPVAGASGRWGGGNGASSSELMPPIVLCFKPWSRTTAELGEHRPAPLAGSSTTTQSHWGGSVLASPLRGILAAARLREARHHQIKGCRPAP
jgi:hypothetical protein